MLLERSSIWQECREYVMWSSKINLKSVYNYLYAPFLQLQKTPLKLLNLFQRYEQLKDVKNNRKQKNIFCFVGLYLKINISSFWLILLDHITHDGTEMINYIIMPTRGNWFQTNPLEHESDDHACIFCVCVCTLASNLINICHCIVVP